MVRKRTISYKSKEGQRIKEIREQKYNEIVKVHDFLTAKKAKLKEKWKFLEPLVDVSTGLYEEVDKLFKKSPVEEITKLTFDKVNEVIKDTKEMADTDIYVQRLNMFEAAGNYPEVRDVVLILNQVLKGLNRYKSEVEAIESQLEYKIQEAKLIEDCLVQFLEYDQELDKSSAEFGKNFPSWFRFDGYFNFPTLDAMNIPNHFGYE